MARSPHRKAVQIIESHRELARSALRRRNRALLEASRADDLILRRLWMRLADIELRSAHVTEHECDDLISLLDLETTSDFVKATSGKP